MKILPITDASFADYGRVVEGYDTAAVLAALAKTPCTDSVVYVPKDETLHQAPGAEALGDQLYGGMPFQLGWCNGHNTKLNCLEYHRDSEFNLGIEDFILLLARQDEIEKGLLDTGKVKAFKVPAGVLVEVYATTLHYAPCHCDGAKGFRVMVALPWGTNTDRPVMENKTDEDALLTARNKWLLAHPESDEAKGGAKVGLIGENIDISR